MKQLIVFNFAGINGKGISMEIIKIVLLAIALVTLAVFGLATKILLKKGGQFPNTHVGGNKFLKRNGVYCAQTQDKIEQNKVKKKINYKNLTFLQGK